MGIPCRQSKPGIRATNAGAPKLLFAAWGGSGSDPSKKWSRHPLVVALLLALALPAAAQTGLPAFGSFRNLGFDTINRGDLNVHATIPVLTRPGRLQPFTYFLTYDSLRPGGWLDGAPTGTLTENSWTDYGACGYQAWIQDGRYGYWGGDDGSGDITTYSYIYVDQNGTEHDGGSFSTVSQNDFGDGGNDSDCPASEDGFSGYNFGDSSGLTMSVDAWGDATIYFPDGGTTDGATYFEDRAGNRVTMSASAGTISWYDNLSASTPALTITGDGTPSSPRLYTYAGAGGSAVVTVKYANYTSLSGTCPYVSGSEYLPSEIDLPDGSKYTFGYDSTARMDSATLPTGGTISYARTGCGGTGYALLTRTESLDPSVDWAWTTTIPSGGTYWDTETDPSADHNQTRVEYSGTYPVETDVYSGASTELQSNFAEYSIDAGNVAEMDAYTEQFGTGGDANQTSETDTFYDSAAKTTKVVYYDWSGNLLKTVKTTYAALGSGGAAEVPTKVEVDDAAGDEAALTEIEYDHVAPDALSGIVQNSDGGGACAAGTICRGNPTKISYYLDDGSTALTESTEYYIGGRPKTVTAPNGGTTTYTYDASGGCNASFATAVTAPVSDLDTSATWDC
ncbi:MAG TPA: hypothetical protein VN515_01715, partial [Terriglobales bacterium]|nr:hypothetical protein [Terriglobales bacterium]